MLYPKVVEENFLYKKEISSIRERIFLLKDHWITQDGKKNCFQNALNTGFTLGNAAYIIDTNRYLLSEIDNLTLKDYFGDLYDKTIFFLKKELNLKSIMLFEDFTLPGFHIFRGPRFESFKKNHFHCDASILRFYEDADNIYSFSSVIDNGGTKAHLEYLDSEERLKSFEYTDGALNLWYAYVKHKIGTCNIEGGQHRITYQGHICRYKDTHYIYF